MPDGRPRSTSEFKSGVLLCFVTGEKGLSSCASELSEAVEEYDPGLASRKPLTIECRE